MNQNQKIDEIKKIILGWQRMLYGAETCATKVFNVITDTPHQPTVTYRVTWKGSATAVFLYDSLDQAMEKIKTLTEEGCALSSNGHVQLQLIKENHL